MSYAKPALHATNVYHYDHVILALRNVVEDVDLVRRFELDARQMEKCRSLHLPNSVLKTLARRVRDTAEVDHKAHSLGPVQLVLPALTRAGFTVRPWHIRWVTASYAKRVAKLSKGHSILHFSEGLGYRALESNSFDLSICERRNFHHNVYEQELEAYGGFPDNGHPDPIGDILDFEYAQADKVLVYSEAAKMSFTERGFEEGKVQVSPIGIGPQLSRIQVDRETNQLLYVGRGDVYKGLDVAVAVTKLLGPPFRLVVAGVMPPSVAKWLKGQPLVDYVGVLDRSQLRVAYSTSAAMILPSTESFGLAAAEGVYHGLPLVCSDRTGIAEYLPSNAKVIVSGREPAIWADAVLRMLQKNETLDRQLVTDEVDVALAKLSWESAAARLEDLYLAELKGAPGVER
ncbi:glycosyltransferase family 4 protein [Arthrobacter sp. 2MCAF14]|uniref:glycosyltransferase family 4 protein n=1 Tax=Arthrobacter sp. 2MCAF14 TaxID=3232982 RepID=UPI003F8DFFA6